jgi:hypothetical protein
VTVTSPACESGTWGAVAPARAGEARHPVVPALRAGGTSQRDGSRSDGGGCRQADPLMCGDGPSEARSRIPTSRRIAPLVGGHRRPGGRRGRPRRGHDARGVRSMLLVQRGSCGGCGNVPSSGEVRALRSPSRGRHGRNGARCGGPSGPCGPPPGAPDGSTGSPSPGAESPGQGVQSAAGSRPREVRQHAPAPPGGARASPAGQDGWRTWSSRKGSPGEHRARPAGNGGGRQRTLARSKALKSSRPRRRDAACNGRRATAHGDVGAALRAGKALEGMAPEGKPHARATRVGGNPVNPRVGSGMQQAREPLVEQTGEAARNREVGTCELPGSRSPKAPRHGSRQRCRHPRDVSTGWRVHVGSRSGHQRSCRRRGGL